MSLWDWILRRQHPRDGSSLRRAIPVTSVAEEYAWMSTHYPALTPDSQMLWQVNGKSYDVLVWSDGQGQNVTVYFDISSFHG